MFKLKKKREEDTVEIVQLDGPSVILEKTKNNTTTDKKKQKVTKSEKNVGPGENSKTGKSHDFKTAKNTCTTVKSGLKKVNEADSNSKNDISLSKAASGKPDKLTLSKTSKQVPTKANRNKTSTVPGRDM